MIRRGLICLGLLVALVLCLPVLPPTLAYLVVRLPWGWVKFLGRVLPEVSLNWSGIGMVFVCSVVAMLCLHWLCGWCYSHWRAGAGEPKPTGMQRWPWRWTGVLYAGFWILFCIVMGAAGLARQSIWLLESQEPLRVERVSHYSELRMAAMEMQNVLMDSEGDSLKTRAAFLASGHTGLSRRLTAWERHHTLFFEDATGGLSAVILFPRDSQARSTIGFAVVGDAFDGGIQPMTNLPAVIARLEAARTNSPHRRQ
jgi:hypothetical protein